MKKRAFFKEPVEPVNLLANFARQLPRHKLLSKRQCEVRRKYGRHRSNQLRGARGASAHACSTGLSTGRRLMPMTARYGAAAPCRGAATVRQLLTRGEWWEAAGCVELTERVQLQLHARVWTKTQGRGRKLVAIQTVAPALPAADCVDRTEQRMQGVGWLCGTHCWTCLDLDCHEFRMRLQLHTFCAIHTASSFPPLVSCAATLTVVAQRHNAAAPHWAVMGIK